MGSEGAADMVSTWDLEYPEYEPNEPADLDWVAPKWVDRVFDLCFTLPGSLGMRVYIAVCRLLSGEADRLLTRKLYQGSVYYISPKVAAYRANVIAQIDANWAARYPDPDARAAAQALWAAAKPDRERALADAVGASWDAEGARGQA